MNLYYIIWFLFFVFFELETQQSYKEIFKQKIRLYLLIIIMK